MNSEGITGNTDPQTKGTERKVSSKVYNTGRMERVGIKCEASTNNNPLCYDQSRKFVKTKSKRPNITTTRTESTKPLLRSVNSGKSLQSYFFIVAYVD